MHELMADYLETWNILRGRLRKITRRRAFLFNDPEDYWEWLNSVTNEGIAEALAYREKWDQKYPFHQFAFLRARTLVRSDLKGESHFRNIPAELVVLERPDYPDYCEDPLESLIEKDEIDRALIQMNPDQVEALALRYEADLQVKDIARLMERTPSSVSVLLHRGKERLAELLSKPPSCSEPRSVSEEGFPSRTRPRARGQLVDEEDGEPPLSPHPDNVIPFPQRRLI